MLIDPKVIRKETLDEISLREVYERVKREGNSALLLGLEAVILNIDAEKHPAANAKFTIFKPSGKYYTEGEGYLPRSVYEPYLGKPGFVRGEILRFNRNRMPGLSTYGDDLTVVIHPYPTCGWGWPIILPAGPTVEIEQ